MNVLKTLYWCGGKDGNKPYDSPVELQHGSGVPGLSIVTTEADYCALKCDLVDLLLTLLVDEFDPTNRKLLGVLIDKCVEKDPEFILKIALHFHKLLDIRKTANLLISIACFYVQCRVFIKKYFNACICTPFDWIEVAECYASLSGDPKLRGMPKALRKCMVSKFCEFDQNQLAQCKRRLSSACSYRCKVSGRGAGDAAVDAVTDTLQSRLVDPSPIHFTLKELVRKLHISKPALNVMCILGKLYPSDVTAFSKTGLEGDWDASKAGACMKLPVHPKWKVELASGKSRDAWIKIIMSGDLCHELILRNLKSILCSRISQTGHDIVLQRLSDAELVIEGKQLPFVYLTAYITVEKLHDMLSMTANRKRLKDMRLQESNKIRSKYLYRSRRSRVRSLNINKGLLNKYLLALTKAMSLSTRYNLSPIRCSVLVICSLCSGFELQKIRRSTRVKAIINVLSFIYGAICNAICENAVVYFVVDNDYNVASINRMLLLLYSSLWHTEENKKDTSLFRSPNPPLMDKIKLIYKNRKLWESYSLSLTLDRFSAFRRKFDKVIVFGDCPDSIAKYVVNYRANIGPIKAIWNNLSGNDKWCTSFPMTGWIESKGLVDNIFKYLSLPDDKCLVEQIDKIDETYKLNSMFDLPLQMNLSSEQQGHNKLSQIKSSQESFCRVYISSSYIDMHAEHNLIYHTLVPNLCQNVAQTCSTCLDLVDLRIGVPQSITCSLIALEMYLKQAAASDIFILLLGDKYGWVPDESLVRALPDSLLAEVNKFYKPGMSVTEMEYHMVKLAAVNKLSRSSFNMFPSTVFVFIRDFNTSDIPNEYGQIFRDHDPVNLQHLDAFKQLLLNDGVSILSYSARFIGVIDDRPMMGNLDNFANQFISTLESTLKRLYCNPVNDAIKSPMVTSSDDNDELIDISECFATYVNPIACNISPRHLLNIQHAFKTMIGKCVATYFIGQHTKSDESSNTTSKNVRIEDRTSNDQNENGGILVITGSPGSGKTVHLAALAMSLATSDHHSSLMSSKDYTRSTSTTRKSMSNSQSLAKYQILIHFTNGIPSTGLPSCKQLSKVLDHWIKCLAAQLQSLFSSSNILKMFLSKIKVNLDSTNTANDHHNLKLKMLCFNKMIWFLGCIPGLNYAFLIDDVDYLDPLILDDWLPSVLPKNVQFIFTCHSNSEIIQKLTCQYNKNTCSVYQIPQLTSEESRAVILSHLRSNGVSCVNSQSEYEIALLISACESNNPSYFDMVCKYLQLCGSRDEVKSHLKMLSGTIDQLIDEIIKNLEVEYKNDLIIATLGFLIFCRHSLSSKELLILLNEWLFTTQNINEKYEMNWENNPWKMLSVIQDKPNDLESICTLESNIDRFILSKCTNNLCALDKSKQLHLTPFAFHILLSRLRPLMIIFNKSLHCFNSTSNGSNNNNSNVISTEKMTLNGKIELWNLGAENLSFLSHSIEEVVFNKFFENHGNYMYSEYTFNATIHKILAVVLSDLDDKLYHFLYADELDIICHLLTSPMFICRILSEYPSTLMRFLNGYPTTDRCIQEKWKSKLELCPFIDKIDAMKTFVCVNYEFLVKYPNSFCELAINQDSSEWIHTLGLSLLYLNDFGIKRQLDMNNSQILFRVNSPKCTLIKPMQRNMTYKPIVTSNGSMDVPTSVEMNPTAKVLVYGTRCGTITFVELSTMRELWSLTGHRSSVQSLCFLDGFPSKPENIKSPEKFISELRLMSASEDGDVYIWDASTVIHNVESKVHDKTVISQLASLCGYHRRCVTTSAWHPRRRLVATGDLDCMVYLWDVSEIGVKSSDLSTSVCSVRLHPVKSINVSSYPIISIAFRLPSVLSNEQEDLIHDDLAIGCWDGTIHFYNLSSLSIVRSLSASTSLCSLAYSPNGGNILATFDKDGVLMLWNDDILWYQGGLIQEYSCFTIEYFPYDQTDQLIPNQYGKICFSKPNGQYIFQSGGGQFLNNYINIWDTRLWGTFGPWIDVKPPQIGSGNPICVTCLTILPTYEHVLIGWSNGDLTVIRVFDGRLIHYLKAATEDNSSIQCITSSCARSFSAFDAYHIIVGYASGAVRIFLCILRPNVSSHKDRCVYQSANAMSELQFQLIDTLWSHCINHNVNGGVPENGGTLCVASDFCVAVTGGGNAETWVHFIGRQTGSKIKKSVCLKEHNSAVIAVSMDSKFFATASKSRQLALYKFDPLERTVTLWHLIDDVGTATITSFYLLRMFLGVDTISISVYIGDSNSLLHNYAIIDKKFELKQTFDANKSPIKFMERVSNHLLAASDDGEVSVWKHDKHGALQFSHRLNVCTDMPSKNNSNNSTLEESYYLTSFFMFFFGYDSLKYQPNQHFGPITCLGQLKITDHYSICISGCMDGSVMFWSLKNSEPLDLKHVSVADLTNNKSIKWKPLLHGFCSALRPKYAISDIATQTYVMDESKRTVQYLIYIAYGENLWRMRIILDQSNMSMNDVQNTFERLFSMNGKTELHFAELDVFWSSELDIPCSDIASFTASHPIVKISPRYAKPNELEQCEVIAVLVNGDVIVLTTNEHEKFSFDQCIVENGLWCSSIGTNVVGVFTTRSGMAFICRHTDESRTFHRISGYMGSCEKEMWINTLSVLSTVQEEGSHLLYLAECHLINCWKILICNENGDLVTDFTLDNSSIKVTGYCAKLLSPTEDNSSTLIYLIIATSDNILRVLGCAINNPITVVNSKQWKEVAMYPVETEITQLYTLDGDSQLKILAGDRQGQIHCFILL
ncbi:unnamed protein product [Schistosoma haematobium]|nr:unnamed protein product [Schistosoma haematobium]